jgi:hypothetical protein
MREYFDKLFNEDSGSSSIELDISSDDLNNHFVRRIQESKVKDDFKRMKGGILMGMSIEVWISLGDVAIVWFTKLFNLIFWSNKMSDECRRSILVRIFKNKGDVQNYTNYWWLWERIKGEWPRHQKPILFYAREIDRGGDFLDKATYGEIQGTKDKFYVTAIRHVVWSRMLAY